MSREQTSHTDTLAESPLWPLNLFYAREGREMPRITPLFDRHLPEPYRKLLVHRNNMTSILEGYHDDTIYIERLNAFDEGEETEREVILRLEGDATPVEYGASRVFLPTLNPQAIELVAGGHVPLGTILNQCNCRHTVEPSGLFKIEPTPYFTSIFGPVGATALYGRRLALVALSGEIMAEVCEILPPLNPGT